MTNTGPLFPGVVREKDVATREMIESRPTVAETEAEMSRATGPSGQILYTWEREVAVYETLLWVLGKTDVKPMDR